VSGRKVYTKKISMVYIPKDKYLSFVVGIDVICANDGNRVARLPSRCQPNRYSMLLRNFRCLLTSHLRDWL